MTASGTRISVASSSSQRAFEQRLAQADRYESEAPELERKRQEELAKADQCQRTINAAQTGIDSSNTEIAKIGAMARQEEKRLLQKTAQHERNAAEHRAAAAENRAAAAENRAAATEHRAAATENRAAAADHRTAAAQHRAMADQHGATVKQKAAEEAAAQQKADAALGRANDKRPQLAKGGLARLLGTSSGNPAVVLPSDGSIDFDIPGQMMKISGSGMERIIEIAIEQGSQVQPGDFTFCKRASVEPEDMIAFFEAIPQMNVTKIVIKFPLSAREIDALVQAKLSNPTPEPTLDAASLSTYKSKLAAAQSAGRAASAPKPIPGADPVIPGIAARQSPPSVK